MEPPKVPNPGHKHVWRLYDERHKATADLLGLDDEDPRKMETVTLHHPVSHTTYRSLSQGELSEIEPLLVDVLEEGKLVYDLPEIKAMRERRDVDLERLDPGVRRIMNPHVYHVSVTRRLWDLKQALIRSAKGEAEGG